MPIGMHASVAQTSPKLTLLGILDRPMVEFMVQEIIPRRRLYLIKTFSSSNLDFQFTYYFVDEEERRRHLLSKPWPKEQFKTTKIL
jgi:hypothetical protein